MGTPISLSNAHLFLSHWSICFPRNPQTPPAAQAEATAHEQARKKPGHLIYINLISLNPICIPISCCLMTKTPSFHLLRTADAITDDLSLPGEGSPV